MPVAAIIGAVGAIGGGTIAALGAKSAAKTANQAADTAAQAQQYATDQATQGQREQLALSQKIYDQNSATLAPYVALGNNVDDGTYLSALGLKGGAAAKDAFDAYRNNSGYNFTFNEGQRAIGGQYAGNGTFNSGARGKALVAYGTGLADQFYGNWLDRLNSYNDNRRRFGLTAASAQAGVGQNLVSNAGNVASNIANLYQNNGNALANTALVKGQNSAYGAAAGSSALANAVGGLGQYAGTFLNPAQNANYGIANPGATGFTYNFR